MPTKTTTEKKPRAKKAKPVKRKEIASDATQSGAGAAQTLPVLPLRGMVAYPAMVLPLFIGREKSVAAIQAASETPEKFLLLLAQKDEEQEEPGADDVHHFGTIGEIVQMMKMPDGNVRVVIEG